MTEISRTQSFIETMQGESFKNAAEVALSVMGRSYLGSKALEFYAAGLGGRIEDPSLHTWVSGIEFDNPVLFGAGWDKKGRAVKGLYHLGFAGGDVGTVLPFGQSGNPQPRLWTIDKDHSVGLNRLGFNSLGEEVVGEYLDDIGPLNFPIGLNVGKNKLMPNEMAPWAHAEVIRKLGHYARYVVLGISSPNTPNLRGLQDKGPLRDNIRAAHEAMDVFKPLYIKIDSERTDAELEDMIEVVLDEEAAGFIACNTYMGSDLKSHYGSRWENEAGGLSGNDPHYRARATDVISKIYERAGNHLGIIGAGGVGTAAQALEKIKAGASAVQVVTAIRPTRGKVAAQINAGLLGYMHADGVKNIQEYIGVDTNRGTKRHLAVVGKL